MNNDNFNYNFATRFDKEFACPSEIVLLGSDREKVFHFIKKFIQKEIETAIKVERKKLIKRIKSSFWYGGSTAVDDIIGYLNSKENDGKSS